MPACLAFSLLPGLAQPVVGSTYKDFLPMGGGASVALPEGAWLSSHNSTITRTGYIWETYTLKNTQVDARVPFLVVRQATGSWWLDVVKGFEEPGKSFKSSMFLAELSVQQFNGKGLRVEAFILPPKGIGAGQFRDAVKAGDPRPEQTMLDTWASIYIESMQQSYFNKKPQPIMALAYPVNAVAQASTPSTPSTPSALSAPAAAPVTTTPPAPPAVTVAVAPAAVTPVKIEPAPAAAVKPAPAAVVASVTAPAKTEAPTAAPKPLPPAAPPVAAAPDTAAQLRLDQERKALDEEKRKMAQQLEAMTQMLAKLQKENAAAAAAAAAATAKAKDEAASLAQAEAAAKTPVTYANRKALVIGNDLYTDVPKLNNAGADAEAMAKSLEAVGYKVYKHLNLNEKKFKQAVRDFRQQLSGGDEVLFFYAGHGVQLGNANYLLPIDVKGDQEDQVKDDAILLQKVLDDLEEKKTKFALAVIDACRDNPFKGKGRAIGGRGLAPTSAATGQMIMFSAGSGQQALDRLGDNDKERNGLFTRIFVKEMLKPGLSVDRVLRNVRNEVVRLARSVGHEQTPALYDQAIGEFYFKQ
eukprot:gene3377-3305_t